MCLVLFCALVPAAPLAAHQQKEAVTRVLFNPRTGNIEVMHRFLLHDAEHAGRELFPDPVDLLGSADDRDRFEGYVHEHFALANQDGVGIALEPVGNELDQRFLWVYAEAPIPEGLTALTISQSALSDLWPGQTHLVNVERDGAVLSLTLTSDRRKGRVVFQAAERLTR